MPFSVETVLSVKSPRRGGKFVSFVPESQQRRCPWEIVEDHVLHDASRRRVAESASLTFNRRGSTSSTYLPVEKASQLRPPELDLSRMPSSHVGMPNYVGVLVAPDVGPRRRLAWFESFNEMHHLLDLIIDSGAEAVVPQPFRLEWRFDHSGVRHHFPDLLVELPGGRRVLVDVTRAEKVPGDSALMAVLRLTAETCDLLGWEYQVRLQMPPQRARNLRFLWADRDRITDHERAEVASRLPAGAWQMRLDEFELLLGGRHGRPLALRVLAAGIAHIDLDHPIAEWSTVSSSAFCEGGAPWLIEL